MTTPLLLDQLCAQYRSALLTDACWERASKRARAGTAAPSARPRPLLSRLTSRAGVSPVACCA